MEVVQKEVQKLLDADVIYPISNSQWVSPVHVVPKKIRITVELTAQGELVTKRIQNGWPVCIDYRKLNVVPRKDHFPLPFIDQMLDRLAGKPYFCFLDGFSGYNQILIAAEDQEKTTFEILSPIQACVQVRVETDLEHLSQQFSSQRR
ncbi:unnamed protein product [Rhodiola kirilowii]